MKTIFGHIQSDLMKLEYILTMIDLDRIDRDLDTLIEQIKSKWRYKVDAYLAKDFSHKRS